MTIIAMEVFNGIAPSLHPQKLAPEMAVVSENTRLDRSVLEPWRDISPVATAPLGTRTIFKYQGSYLTSPDYHHVVGAVRPNDPLDRIYYTDTDYPKIRSGASIFRLGLPKPALPNVSVTDPGDKENITDVFNTRYRITLVDAWGAEGPPSDPSVGVELGLGFSVSLDLTTATVTGNYNFAVGSLIRIYRSNSGSGEGVYQYVGEVSYGSASFVDTTPREDLQEALPSEGWIAAPDENTSLYPDGPLASLIEAPWTGLVGHSGNTVYCSEPGVPTAWPYYYSNQHKIVGIALIQSGILVLTEAAPYLLVGSHPSALAKVPIEAKQACVSARSIVDFGEYTIYASPDGLVLAQGNSATVITQEFMDTDAWRAFQPETIHAYEYEGMYIGFYGDHAAGTGFVFDPTGERNSLVQLSGIGVTGGYFNALTDTLDVVYQEGAEMYIGNFNEGVALEYYRVTKEFMFPDPVSLHCVRVEAQGYPIQLTAWADGQERGTWTFTDNQVVKLPGGYRARQWQWGVRGQGTVIALIFADNMGEMV